MRVVLGSDHAGFELKRHLLEVVRGLGHQVTDKGAFDEQPSDYPDYAEAVGLALRGGEAERGILICGSGVGAAIAACKMGGIRAGVCHDVYSAHQGVEHDDMNVLVLGARIIGSAVADELVGTFLRAAYTGEARHQRRLAKVRKLEEKYAGVFPKGEKA
jgi:ribose 5-phosphate isomerase B